MPSSDALNLAKHSKYVSFSNDRRNMTRNVFTAIENIIHITPTQNNHLKYKSNTFSYQMKTIIMLQPHVQ